MNISRKDLLKNVPEGLRDPLFSEFDKICRNYRENRWEPAELNGGKLCEIVYSILKGYVDNSFPDKPSKPTNMVDSCRALESAGASFSRAIRIQIPRMLMSLYEIRNNRGVGHTGGTVDPNEMDAAVVLGISKWIIADLVREFHGLTTEQATNAVSFITERTIPIVWEIDGKKRILETSLTYKETTLLLLYSSPLGVLDSVLIGWTEHSNPSNYRNKVLSELHNDRLIEYDKATGSVKISPKGVAFVENKLVLHLKE